MRDSNYPVRKAYYQRLAGITYNSVLVPVYYQEAPNDVKAPNYIVINAPSNNDASTLTSIDTFTTMSVTIHTRSNIYNSGSAADIIAGEVLYRIHPSNAEVLDLSASNMQCVFTTLSNDFTQNYGQIGDEKFIDRVLTFRHQVLQLQ